MSVGIWTYSNTIDSMAKTTDIASFVCQKVFGLQKFSNRSQIWTFRREKITVRRLFLFGVIKSPNILKKASGSSTGFEYLLEPLFLLSLGISQILSISSSLTGLLFHQRTVSMSTSLQAKGHYEILESILTILKRFIGSKSSHVKET